MLEENINDEQVWGITKYKPYEAPAIEQVPMMADEPGTIHVGSAFTDEGM
ncbi:MAG: hypothetical protein PUH24_06240 [Prevotellaceae bacterium]|nr:hypothetical protein [Prevotellaceae bacterium]MDY6130555.1 hypothetical protein [Prevotella sp.]